MIHKGLAGTIGLVVAMLLAACGSVSLSQISFIERCAEKRYADIRWSPDGAHIAYTDSEDAFPSHPLYMMNAYGSGMRQVINLPLDAHSLQWLPDSQSLAYFDVHAVHVIGVDGSSTSIHLSDDRIRAAAYSPDGAAIAYTRENEGGLALGISRVNRDGSGPVELTSGGELFEDWSPDGKRIAYTYDGYQYGRYVTFVGTMAADGSDIRWLASNARNAEWSPDGEWLNFRRYFEDHGLYVIRPDGTDERLVSDDWTMSQSAWLPDSQHIAYLQRELPPQVIVADVNSLSIESISTAPITENGLAWSPDGSKVLFVGIDPAIWSTEVEDIYMVNRDGSGLIRLTDNPGRYQCFNWPF